MTKQLCMSFHGTIAITRLRRAVDLACDEIHNQIATCPDRKFYAADLEELERELTDMRSLSARIGRKLDSGVATCA